VGHTLGLIQGNLNSKLHHLINYRDIFFMMICSIYIRNNKCRCIISWMVATTPASPCQYSISCGVLTHKLQLSKVIPHSIKTTDLSSISKTAKWGRLEVHMNYCPCILLFFCILPHSLTFTFNWFGPNIIFFHSCGNRSCCRSLYYQMFFTELEMRISHIEAMCSAFLSLCDLVAVLTHLDKLSWNLTSQTALNSCQEIVSRHINS